MLRINKKSKINTKCQVSNKYRGSKGHVLSNNRPGRLLEVLH